MKYLISTMLIVAAIIHLLPVSGVLGAAQLEKLYGLPFNEPNLAILMRHRAVLFGLLGAFLLIAAFIPAWQTGALIAGLISVVSFLWLAGASGGYNPELARVFKADMVALVCLVIGLLAHIAQRWN
jgi:hypothetical protein